MSGDPQQNLVYAMERAELRGFSWHRAPLPYLRRKVRRVCRAYGIPIATVSVRRLRCGATYRDGSITLDIEDQNAATCAHELAHHVVVHRYPSAQDHGPTWAHTYGQMLRVFRVMTPAAFAAICRQYGVRNGLSRRKQ